MIRITVELLNANKGGERSLLGMMDISNDGTGTPASGNYDGQIYRMLKGQATDGITRKGRVVKHARKTEVIWKLLQKMLNTMYPDPCKNCEERNLP